MLVFVVLAGGLLDGVELGGVLACFGIGED